MRSKQRIILIISGLLILVTANLTGGSVSAAPASVVTENQVELNFPDSVTFHAGFENQVPIDSIVLEYGTTQLTCGTVVAKAIPQFTPGASVTVTWTWEMKQSGSLPPGTTIWWRWRYSDQDGVELVSDEETVTWLDGIHDWQTLTSGPINLHWYHGDRAFGQELLAAAEAGLTRLQKDAGLSAEAPIQLYIYANTSDMQEAILYEPSWTGGMAFPTYDIVIIGISPDELEWGRTTIAHELTHVLVGHLTYSCLGDVPTWLNEGLAVYSEGELDPGAAAQLDQAIRSDQLLSVRALSGGFSEVPSRAYLSYSQSYSIVKFLVENYGQDRMNTLLLALRDGSTIDEALRDTYGFDVEGLEALWRKAVGAPPGTTAAQPVAQATPTTVPTYVPFAAEPLVLTPTPYSIPTSSGGGEAGSPGGPPLSLTVTLLAIGCILLLLLSVIVIGFLLARQRLQRGHDESNQ